MNILNLTNKGYSARFFAGITIVSLLLSAFPAAFFVANAASLYSSASASADMSAEFASGNIDASGFNNLVLSFDYEAEALDSGDSFTYGWRAGSGDNDLVIAIDGVNEGPAGDETDAVSIALPSGAEVSNLEVYVKVSADAANDVVNLSNISVSGDVVPAGPVENTDTSETFATIQAAIDDADTDNGDNIVVAAGTYNENVVVNKEVSITGAGKASTEVVAATGVALQISANNVTISDLSATGATYAFEVKTGTIENLSLDSVMAHNSSVGLKVDSNTSIDGLDVADSNFDDNSQGWTIAAASSGATDVTNVSVANTTFNNNAIKGLYAEKLNNADFENITIDGSGNGGNNGSGFNVNLKYSDYSNITLSNSTVNNSGVGVSNGTGVHITARDDGSSYGGAKAATLSNVTLEGNEITNNEVGVRFGEPGKNNAGPSDVTVYNNNIVNNSVIGLDNQTAQTDLDAESNWWGDISGPSGEGAGSGDIVSEFVSFSPWLCALAPSTETTTNGFCGPKTETTVEVTGNTLTYYDEPGTWWFNRDVSTQSEFEFNNNQQTIGSGALYVEPIDGSINGNNDKFIGELFVHELVKDVETISYKYRLGDSVPSGKANEFYANVYINTDGSDNYGHCVYNVVPTDGSAGWHTMVFDPAMSHAVNTRGSYPGPGSCPASPSDLPNTAEIRVFAINLGDTSNNDLNVDGYFDEVVLETNSKITTFDFEQEKIDNMKPSVVLLTPTQAEVVGTDFTVNGTATDTDSGIDYVTYTVTEVSAIGGSYVSNVDSGIASGTENWSFDVNGVPSGFYRLKAQAFDKAGNSKYSNYNDVEVDAEKPSVVISTPDNGQQVMAGTVIATGTASDAQTSIKEVKYTVTEIDAIGGTYVANVTNGVTNGAEEWDFSVEITTPGFYRLKVQAFDQDGNWKYRYHDIEVTHPIVMCHLPYLVTFGDDSDETTYSTSVGTGFIIEEIVGGYTVGLYDDGRSGVYSVNGTITFPVGTDTSSFAFSEPSGYEGLEQANILYPDVADRIGNEINFELHVNGANDIFTITDESLESVENCSVPTPEPEPDYIAHCGDGEINGWEQCELGDEGCTDYCTLDNQCSSMQLVKITLDENSGGPSFDGMLYLGGEDKMIPNGTWFKFDEVGDQSYVTTGNSVEGLAIERNQTDGTLAIAFDGVNDSGQTDIASGMIETMGIDLGAIDRTPNSKYKLEDVAENPRAFDDVFAKIDENINFNLRADTGADGVTVEIKQGEEYDCPECKAAIEARVVLGSTGFAGVGSELEGVILGDSAYTTVEFGEWFPISVVESGETSATMISDPNTVTNFDSPEDKDGLFVSRENGTIKVALYGEFAQSKTDNEWIDARIEVRDAGIVNFVELSGDFKFENHPETDSESSNDGFDEASSDLSGVDFKMWVDTGSDGFKFDVDTNSIAACEDDTVDLVSGTLEITNPAVNGLTLADTHTFEANYQDADEDEDVVYWAIRAETCSGSDMVGNTPASPFHPSTYNSTTGLFETAVDMSAWSDGDYCLVVNPREDAPADDLRATRTFVLENSTSTEGEPDETPDEGQETEEDEIPSSNRSGGSTSGTLTNRFSFASAPVGQVLGATTIDSCPFLLDYMQVGVENDSNEVRKLQMFLNIFKSMFGGTENPVTGVFGPITDANVKAFQEHYRSEVLDPWFERGIVPHNRPTGFVYKTTLYKINSIVCPDSATEPDLDGEDLTTNVDID